jgi:hypothetical protein
MKSLEQQIEKEADSLAMIIKRIYPKGLPTVWPQYLATSFNVMGGDDESPDSYCHQQIDRINTILNDCDIRHRFKDFWHGGSYIVLIEVNTSQALKGFLIKIHTSGLRVINIEAEEGSHIPYPGTKSVKEIIAAKYEGVVWSK